MPTRPRVFVSYSSPDVAKANAICAALEAAGVPCWIAPRDLSAGTRWGAGIVQAIEACQVVLTVAGAAVVAVVVALLMRPSFPTGSMQSPLAGRWRAKALGGQAACVLDVQKTGMASFSDDCPAPLTAVDGALTLQRTESG